VIHVALRLHQPDIVTVYADFAALGIELLLVLEAAAELAREPVGGLPGRYAAGN
jgi:hypothetical protein